LKYGENNRAECGPPQTPIARLAVNDGRRLTEHPDFVQVRQDREAARGRITAFIGQAMKRTNRSGREEQDCIVIDAE
jgi:hypothetical protein